MLDAFPDEYDHPYATACRSYLRDLATPEVDLSWLADQFARRRFAAPLPGERDPSADGIDATDSHGRAEIALAEFAECGGGGADTIRAADRGAPHRGGAWHDNPATTWERAKTTARRGT